MATATLRRISTEPYLDERDGVVYLADPSRPDDDDRRLGRIDDDRTADEVPRKLWDAYDRLYSEWVREVMNTPGGGRYLRAARGGEWS